MTTPPTRPPRSPARMICPGAAMAADSAVATEVGHVVSWDGDVLMTILPGVLCSLVRWAALFPPPLVGDEHLRLDLISPDLISPDLISPDLISPDLISPDL